MLFRKIDQSEWIAEGKAARERIDRLYRGVSALNTAIAKAKAADIEIPEGPDALSDAEVDAVCTGNADGSLEKLAAGLLEGVDMVAARRDAVASTIARGVVMEGMVAAVEKDEAEAIKKLLKAGGKIALFVVVGLLLLKACFG